MRCKRYFWGMAPDFVFSEVKLRFEADVAHFDGQLSRDLTLAWGGYLAGMFEWGAIKLAQYVMVYKLLPKLELHDPIIDVFALARILIEKRAHKK